MISNSKEIHKKLTFLQQVSDLFEISKDKGYSIVSWKTPDSDCIHVLVSENEHLSQGFDLDETKSGFCIVPFEVNVEQSIFLKNDFYINSYGVEIFKGTTSLLEGLSQTTQYSKEIKPDLQEERILWQDQSGDDFKDNVKKAVEEIKKGNLKKVVISRVDDLLINKEPNLIEVFERLIKFSNAFVSWIYTPSLGIQMGASPEILVKSNGTTFNTVALAGTQKYNEGMDLNAASWTQKEIEEQALVSRYIIECFKKIRLREYDDIGPRTVRAGNILHLKTEFKVDMKELAYPELASVMLKLLHPTSAVCGTPLESAQRFILQNEKHRRAYFAGFLGPVNIDNETNIYVNIRCARIYPSYIRFYAGAGITENSDPDKEFIETENKIQFLKQYFI